MTHVILVVEDNERNLKLLRDVLEYAGYDVRVARTGEDGVGSHLTSLVCGIVAVSSYSDSDLSQSIATPCESVTSIFSFRSLTERLSRIVDLRRGTL